MHFRFFAIDKERIGFPDFVEKLPVHGQSSDAACLVKDKSGVVPRLTKVTVHIIILLLFTHWTL